MKPGDKVIVYQRTRNGALINESLREGEVLEVDPENLEVSIKHECFDGNYWHYATFFNDPDAANYRRHIMSTGLPVQNYFCMPDDEIPDHVQPAGGTHRRIIR